MAGLDVDALMSREVFRPVSRRSALIRWAAACLRVGRTLLNHATYHTTLLSSKTANETLHGCICSSSLTGAEPARWNAPPASNKGRRYVVSSPVVTVILH